MKLRIACAAVGFLSFALSLAAQTSGSSSALAQVPPLIQFSSVATDEGGNTMSSVVSITFSLYSGQQGGDPLWSETQNNVQLDSTGHYSVQLGITKANGVPTTLFTTGEARWMGIRIAEQTEQPRVLLLSVPYALKAGDAATIGGLPPSAFMLAAPGMGSAASATTFMGSTVASSDTPVAGDVTGTGTANFIPLWTTTSNIANSVLFQSGTGASVKIGVNNTAPATTLDVKGAGTIRGILNLPAIGVATAAGGKNSQPLSLVASAFNTTAAVNQTFRWQAEPSDNDTATPSGTLNLLFAEGTSAPAETGLHIASNGQINFAPGQTFPGTGTGNGTVTSVAAGNGLKGGTITKSGTLSVDPTMVAFLGVENKFTASQNVVGTLTATNVSASGTVTGVTVNGTTLNAAGGLNLPNTTFGTSSVGVISLGGTPFVQNWGNNNTFVGAFAGNTTMPGAGQNRTGSNSAFGYGAFSLNTGGELNDAFGASALSSNTTGIINDAFGVSALSANTTGGFNDAFGFNALANNTTGSFNTTYGATSLLSNTTGNLNSAFGFDAGGSNPAGLSNTTAIGAHAQVSENNALVLGSINGLNNATASVSVGIGTPTPAATLDVRDNGSGGNTISAITAASTGSAVFGSSSSTTGVGNGGFFDTYSGQGSAVVGINYGSGSADQAGYFQGNVVITGSLSKGSGSFKIDHPLDPANKYLYHSFVESPDMMNVYNGNIVTNQRGLATVTLPDYFEALNRDFRYQLTVIGKFAQAIVAKEISGNRFTIRTSKPGVKVSWQVTGVRHDAYADAHRIQVEVEKPPQEQGRYLHPELFGAPAEQTIGYPVPKGSTQSERSLLKVAASLPQ